MISPRSWFRRLAALFSRERSDRDLAAELDSHIQMHIDDKVHAGMSPEEARRAALIRLGGLEQTKERYRERRGVPWLETLAQDVRFGLRVLRKSPGFTAVAVATLALGIGANTAVFSVINSVLLRPLPYPEPERLVEFDESQSLPDLEDIAAMSRSFAEIGAINKPHLDYVSGDVPQQVTAGLCNPGFFRALGTRPQLGRLLTREDDRAGSARVAVVSHGFWLRELGGARDVLGRTISLSGKSYTVVGVLSPDFWFPGSAVDVFLSFRVVAPEDAPDRTVHELHTVLRLAPGVSLAQAQADMHRIDAVLAARFPTENGGRVSTLAPLRESVVSESRATLLILFGAVGLVLLIACVNFAALLLARATARRREMTIRTALGAGTWRLVRQLVTESLLLSLAGGAAGLLIARAGVRALVAIAPGGLPRAESAVVDGTVLAFTTAIAVLTGLVFGLLPAVNATRLDLERGLAESSRATTDGGRGLRLRRSLVIAEIALALILLAGAELLIRSFWRLKAVDPGFRSSGILTMRIELSPARYAEVEQQRQFRSALLDALNSSPDYEAAIVSELPMSGDSLTHKITIEGSAPTLPGREPEVEARTVSAGYFHLLGIPVLRGRDFSPRDRPDGQYVTVVNSAFVNRYLAGRDPIGARFRWVYDDAPRWMPVVGVVADVKHFGLARPEQPAVYDSYAQFRQRWKRWMYLAVRSKLPPSERLDRVRSVLRSIDRQIPLTKIRTMDDVVSGSLAAPRFNLILLGLFAVLAVGLAAIGIYGVTSYAVLQRTPDLGIRLALGAMPGDIVALVVGDGARLALTGAVLGVAGALALTRLMSSLLFGIGARDPIAIFSGVAILGAVALLASYVPARSASRLDPTLVLRSE